MLRNISVFSRIQSFTLVTPLVIYTRSHASRSIQTFHSYDLDTVRMDPAASAAAAAAATAAVQALTPKALRPVSLQQHTVTLPGFWQEDPVGWFQHAEAEFLLARIPANSYVCYVHVSVPCLPKCLRLSGISRTTLPPPHRTRIPSSRMRFWRVSHRLPFNSASACSTSAIWATTGLRPSAPKCRLFFLAMRMFCSMPCSSGDSRNRCGPL
jgi:hypothetical protein